MQLVIGGAFSGKRRIVKERLEDYSWVTGYAGDTFLDWETKWQEGSALVLEGWEKWIAVELEKIESNDEIRRAFTAFLEHLAEEERKRESTIFLIMLEMGKGVVPMEKDERRLRDIAGWVAQDAARLADRVDYVWNGLARRVK